MELIAIGDKLYGKFNGKALPVVTDARLTEGEMGFQTRHLARDIEVINLDGLSEAEALKAAGLSAVFPSPSPQVPGASSTFPLGKWTKVFTKEQDIPAFARKVLEWHDGWIDGSSPTSQSPVPRIPGTKGRSQGIRLRGKTAAGVNDLLHTSLFVRLTPASASRSTNYRLSIRGIDTKPSVALAYTTGEETKKTDLNFIWADPPPKLGDEFDMELIAIGDKLYGKFNGKPLPVVTDARLTEGEMGFQTRHLARDIDVINLDGLSEAEALKAAGVEGK
jgi:hypothetical protein